MKTIHKYRLEVDSVQHIPMPAGAEILSLQVQDGTPCLWAMAEDTETLAMRHFETFGTGRELCDGTEAARKYVGTYQLHGGGWVLHVFERI